MRLLPMASYDTFPTASRLTTFRRTKRPFKVSEERFRLQQLAAIVASAEDAIISAELDGTIVTWNKAAEHLYGYTEEEMLGKSALLLAPPHLVSEIQGLLDCVARGESVQHLETVRMRKDGSCVDVSISISPVLDRGRNVIGGAAIARNITLQKEMERRLVEHRKELSQAKEHLQESKEQLEVILRGIVDGIIVQNRDGQVIYVNDAMLHLTGSEKFDDFLEKDPREIAHVLEIQDESGAPPPFFTLPPHDIAWTEQLEVTMQYLNRKTKSVQWAAVRSSPIFDQAGQIQYIVHIIHDFTEEREAKEALQRREEQYRSLAEAVPTIVFTATPDGVVDYYNKRWYDYTGMKLEESLLLGAGPVLHPEDYDLCQERWKRAIETGMTYDIEYRLRHSPDGEYRWHLGRAVPVRDADGAITKWFGTCTDIDDQKRAEERIQKDKETLERRVQERTRELAGLNESLAKEIVERMKAEEKDRANLQRLHEIVESLPMAAIATDEDGVILHMNAKFPALLSLDIPSDMCIGRQQEDIVEMLADKIVNYQEYSRLRHAMLRERKPMSGQEIRLFNGSVLERDYIPIFDHGVFRGHLALYRDVTRERRMDATKSEFMALASHQLRTPLTSIRWALGRLERLLGKRNDRRLHLLHEARNAAVRMTETINTMLAISRIEAGKITLARTEISLHDFLRSLEQQYQDECVKRSQTFSLRCSDQLRLTTDAHFLKEIIQNLLSNAIKYTPDGGTITVSASLEDGLVMIDVTDTGYGIPVHQQERIFSKFFRGDNIVDKEMDGTGLGLYLVYLLSEMLGGAISFVSEEGKGSTFTLRLPTS